MVEKNQNVDPIVDVWTQWCNEKGLQVQPSPIKDGIKLDISDLSDRVNVNIYNRGTILVQGKKSTLKTECDSFKKDFENDRRSFIKKGQPGFTAYAQKYDIMLPALRNDFKKALEETGYVVKITNLPQADKEYVAQVTSNGMILTVTQYKTGTLLIQGRKSPFFEELCDVVERVAKPGPQDIAVRYISGDEKSLEVFAKQNTIEIITIAENNIRTKLGKAFDYLELHDQNGLIAAECLRIANIPLPEYSPIVMPASKAYEGFAQKLLTGIGLFSAGHFSSKNATFRDLNDYTNPNRKKICNSEKHADTYLKKINVALDEYRHFMMHSDSSSVTKLNTLQEAEAKLTDLLKSVKENFEYFNHVFKFMP